MRFILICCIWDRLVGSQKLGAKRAYRCKSSSYQVAYEFYATNAPNPPNWTLNSCCLCFVLFGSIWDCLVALLGAKRAKLVPKFWPRSRVRIFHNERNRSTPLDPKLMFWSVFYYLGAFGTVWLPYKTRCKRDRTGAKVHATKSHRNFSQLKHPIRPIGPQTPILVRFVLFRCILDPLVALQHSVQNGSNWCKSSCHKVALEFFTMNANRSTPLDSKLFFSCFLYYLGAFGTVWLPSNTLCKTGQTGAKVRATKSRRNFTQ